MMDLKEIIRWFIPCFHVLVNKKVNMCQFVYIFLFLMFFARSSCGASLNSANTKNLVSLNTLDINDSYNQSDYYGVNNTTDDEQRSLDLELDTSIGRTFGRPIKKMMQALVPLAFQIGASSSWMLVAALLGFKTLIVALAIFKLLLVAGAAKLGAVFSQKTHGNDWHAPQKEVHLHIHGQHQLQHQPHDDHILPWNRDGATNSLADNQHYNIVLNPYSTGPQTISTPYGNYVRIDSLTNQGVVKFNNS